MIIDQLPSLVSVQDTDEVAIERGTTTYKTTQAALVKTATDAAAAAQAAADNAQDTADEANAKGLPSGGTAGQVLTKTDSSDYSASWEDPSGGGDVTADMLGIVINGNSTPVGAAIGQYVIVKDSTISGVTDGLYTAAQAIPANTAIDATYLTAVSVGGLNALNSAIKVDSFTISKRPTTVTVFAPAGFGVAQNDTTCFVMCFLPVQWVNKANMSVSVSNVNDWCLYGDSFHPISDIRVSADSTNCVMLEITSSGLTAGACYRMYANGTQSATLTITVS